MVALGIAQGAFDAALAYVNQREQFGQPIAEFQSLQWMLADMSIHLEAVRLLLYRAASPEDGSFPDIMHAAQAKVFAAEIANKITNDVLQSFGSSDYAREMPLERHVLDVRMFTIAGPIVEIPRTQVARGLLQRTLPQTHDAYVVEHAHAAPIAPTSREAV